MKHVIIGGNGFLGRETVRQLIAKDSCEILILDLAESYEQHPVANTDRVSHAEIDVAAPGALDNIALNKDDVVHHMATRLITPNKPRFGRDDYFNYCAVQGTTQILSWMKKQGNKNLVFWSTDMVYGPAHETPRPENHPKHPFGPYGRSKVAAEAVIAASVERDDVNCTVFRPRLILGPGRLGILETLFKLIDRNWPVPLIGPGENRFQFVSVADCARASIIAADAGCPNAVFNLGTDNSPTEYDLLSGFIKDAGSKSVIIKTPGWLTKFVLRMMNLIKIAPMDPEQFEIADLDVALDTSAAKRELGWESTESDESLLLAAYTSYRAALDSTESR